MRSKSREDDRRRTGKARAKSHSTNALRERQALWPHGAALPPRPIAGFLLGAPFECTVAYFRCV